MNKSKTNNVPLDVKMEYMRAFCRIGHTEGNTDPKKSQFLLSLPNAKLISVAAVDDIITEIAMTSFMDCELSPCQKAIFNILVHSGVYQAYMAFTAAVEAGEFDDANKKDHS